MNEKPDALKYNENVMTSVHDILINCTQAPYNHKPSCIAGLVTTRLTLRRLHSLCARLLAMLRTQIELVSIDFHQVLA